MLTATPGDVWIDWSQFLIGKVEHLNMKIPIHTVLLSQFLIGKVEHSYSIVGGVFGRASQKRRSQFLIGKV